MLAEVRVGACKYGNSFSPRKGFRAVTSECRAKGSIESNQTKKAAPKGAVYTAASKNTETSRNDQSGILRLVTENCLFDNSRQIVLVIKSTRRDFYSGLFVGYPGNLLPKG